MTRAIKTCPFFPPLALLALVLSGCANHLPNTAVASANAESKFSSVNEATPLATLIKERNIQPLDPAAPLPLLSQLQRELQKSDAPGRYKGITYNLTTANAIDGEWIVQTPNHWGRAGADLSLVALDCKNCLPDIALPACRSDADCAGGTSCRPVAATGSGDGKGQRVCVGHSDAMIDRYYTLVAGAQQSVDITALQPPPDGRFLAGLRNAVTALARSGRKVTMRVLIGQYPLEGSIDAKTFLAELIRDAKAVPRSRLTIYVAGMRSCTGEADCASFSWNHSKIVAVDGRAALVGGHNQWSRDYLVNLPVHDLSMQLRGPAAADASHFADTMWGYVCAHAQSAAAVQISSFSAGQQELGNQCLATLAVPAAAGAGGVAVMAVGRLGGGITTDFANQSELARDLMLSAARRNIYIAQQDLVLTLGRAAPTYPESTLERLVDFMLQRQGDVFIVLSDFESTNSVGASYTNGVPLEDVAWKFRAVARARSQLSDEALNEQLCRHLSFAPLRFGPDATWPDKKPIANHSKFWMVDDRFFYIGSDNMYPVNLQEFGYIVDSRAAAGQLRTAYWDKLWQWSRRAAISGLNAPRCLFTEKPTAPPRKLSST